MRKLSSCDESTIVDPDTVMDFVLLPDSTENRNSLGDRRLVDEYLGEPPLERRILLDVLPVLRKCRCTDAAELTTG